MPRVEMTTVRHERTTIPADSILALLRGAGFDIPEDAVLRVVLGNDDNVENLFFVHALEPTVQWKKVSSYAQE